MSDDLADDLADTPDALLSEMGDSPLAGFAVVALNEQGHGAVTLASTPDEEVSEAFTEVNLVALLLRGVAQEHGKAPMDLATAAGEIAEAEEAMASPLDDLLLQLLADVQEAADAGEGDEDDEDDGLDGGVSIDIGGDDE